MSWRKYYNLLVKYGSDIERATQAELDQAGRDCPGSVEYHKFIAEVYYRRLTRRNQQLQFL